jgi:hypothetical protein
MTQALLSRADDPAMEADVTRGHREADTHESAGAERISAGEALRVARKRGLRLVAFAAMLEILLVMPFVDQLANAHPMVHFTQHGFIFAGGVLMGLALRDVQRASRS